MRGIALAVAALLISAVPAEAAWQYYACPSDNFASQFPDSPKLENGRFSMPRHGLAKSAHIYTATVDNVVYRMMVADYSDRAGDGASIMEEAIFQHTEADDHGQQNGKVIGNVTTRIEPVGRGATYGRSITMDLPNNGGRNLTNFYFRDGRLYEQSVVILPANGDYGSPNASRFVESLLFNLTRMDEETGSTPPNIQGCGPTIQPFNYK
ncbi:MAG TPA: hypothetical protein VNH44_03175 [Micropepsaceae bacterium]|nr:hypothetical protein [Micropepsaceae bacterium]